MRNLILKILIASASLMACDADTIIIDRPNDGGQEVNNCDQEVIISSELFDIASDNRLTINELTIDCLLYTSPSPRDKRQSRMPSSA